MTRVADLTGADLALWVAKAVGLDVRNQGMDSWVWIGGYHGGVAHYIAGKYLPSYAPHEDWSQGGPLIDQFDLDVCREYDGSFYASTQAHPHVPGDNGVCGYGETRLIAAMRALVASVYGAEVPA